MLRRLREWMGDRRAPGGVRRVLPWYVNDTLGEREREEVERWLAGEPGAAEDLASWQRLHAAVQSLPLQEPPAPLRGRVLAQVAGSGVPRVPQVRSWALGVALSLVVLLLLWGVARPGIVLQWEVHARTVTAFRIYRAPAGSGEFELLREVEARPEEREYTYVDLRSVPVQTYVYRVEGVGAAGQLLRSAAVTISGQEALPAQVAVILVSLAAGWGGIVLTEFTGFGRMRLVGTDSKLNC